MRRLGFKAIVYHGEVCLGEVDTVPVKDGSFKFPNNEIRIHRISPNSERCHPLAVLQTISSSVLCKLEPPNSTSTGGVAASVVSSASVDQSQLTNLHASCFYELKTAVVLLGNEEVHLVAMPSKLKKFPCFWCYTVPCGLYEECLGMLNLRCLAIVFDLDETLIVANTMKSFEDRIEALRGWIQRDTDPVRVSGMSAEMKRYADDRALLKQYVENDRVVDGGRVYMVQQEDASPLSDGHERLVRPVIRLPEKNIVLTRINPEIRDTSVLVRLRPAWEDLRSYVTAKGRRRFQVYVCTMAERDYALEMWRLLDPESHLISLKQLSERVVCVKSGARKSLHNVFQDKNCHPTMAMVIDDRLKVWEDIDQPRVHVVPAFTPYYAPQAEASSAVPVLCVARNVACNVRGGFFKDFDENLLRKISEVFYEDEVANVPSSPDVSNYLISEDISFAQNGNAHPPVAEGMNGSEVARRITQLEDKNNLCAASHPTNNGIELKAGTTQLSSVTLPNMSGVPSLKPVPPSDKPSLLGDPFRRDINFSEADPDLKRRSLMLNREQEVKHAGSTEPPILPRVPGQLPPPPLQSQGGWLVEEDINDCGLSTGIVQEFDASRPDKQLGSQTSRRTDVGPSPHQLSTNGSKDQPEGGKAAFLPAVCISVLQEIGRRCHAKVEFRPVVGTSADLQFSVEVYFTGEKIGVGMGKTRKDAQQHAAENALRSLADKYTLHVAHRSRPVDRGVEKLSNDNENGFLWDSANIRSDEDTAENGLAKGSTSEVAEGATAGTSDSLHEKMENHGSSRMGQFSPNKRLREDLPHDSNKRSRSREDHLHDPNKRLREDHQFDSNKLPREELPHDSQGL